VRAGAHTKWTAYSQAHLFYTTTVCSHGDWARFVDVLCETAHLPPLVRVLRIQGNFCPDRTEILPTVLPLVHTLYFAARQYANDFAFALPALQRLHISSVKAISYSGSISVANSPVPHIPLCTLDARDCPLSTMLFYYFARFEAMRHLVEAKLDCPWDSCFSVVSFCFAQDRLARLTLHVSGSSSDIFFPSGSLSMSPSTGAHTRPRLADAGDACARRADFCGRHESAEQPACHVHDPPWLDAACAPHPRRRRLWLGRAPAIPPL
jgi:hypothetical protein